MKYVTTLLTILIFLISSPGFAQVSPSHIAKIGYASDFMPFQEDGHFSIHLDLENSTRNNFVTNEFGLGFMRNGSDLYYAKFDYKFYPISALLRNFKYQIFYFGLGPGFYYEDVANANDKIGLGVFTTGGIQFLLNNRISMAFEVEMDFVSNLATETGAQADRTNRYFSNSVKVGYVFNRKSKALSVP
ncbi:MAG: hypothetical protein HC819_01970 [Cyclobacteriaceae bacterium]|nr:hypothetical protein [Cyclobacteriaceae bacterium]